MIFCNRSVFTLLALCLLLAGIEATAAPEFPGLTGRVVDNAGLLSAASENHLTDLLAAHENASSDQIVVVTLSSLQGYSIEEFAYQLGRHWGIGQKDKNNGVLLIVAPNERKVRIEVGYGLEGDLTDALSHNIIQQKILPAFRKNNYEAGVVQGAEAILAVLQGNYTAPPPESSYTKSFDDVLPIGIIAIVIGNLFGGMFRKRLLVGSAIGGIGGVIAGIIVGSLLMGAVVAIVILFFTLFGGSMGGGRYGGRSFGGGGFSGGGGSFGGGGSSGSW